MRWRSASTIGRSGGRKGNGRSGGRAAPKKGRKAKLQEEGQLLSVCCMSWEKYKLFIKAKEKAKAKEKEKANDKKRDKDNDMGKGKESSAMADKCHHELNRETAKGDACKALRLAYTKTL